jgi:hypothetical protein
MDDSHKGRKSRKRRRSKKDMRKLGAKGGASSQPGAALQRQGIAEQLAELVGSVASLNGSWACVPADDSTGHVFNAKCASSAHVMPADMATMGMTGRTPLPIDLYDLRITRGETIRSYDLQLNVLGQPISASMKDALFDRVSQDYPVPSPEGAAATNAPNRASWGHLFDMHGVLDPMLAVMHALCDQAADPDHGVDFAPCSGVPIDDAVRQLIGRRLDSWMSSDKFYSRDLKTIVARPAIFPVGDARAVTGQSYDGLGREVLRTSSCVGIVPVPAEAPETGGFTCDICAAWRDQSLRRSMTVEYKAPEAVGAANHRLSDAAVLVVNPQIIAQRKQSLRKEMRRASVTLRLEREKMRGSSVRFASGKTAPIEAVFLAADAALKGGALKGDKRAEKLFKKGSLFRSTWEAQIQGAKVLEREQKKLDAEQSDVAPEKRATGRGMRYSPILMRWALKLYGQSRAAYRRCATDCAHKSFCILISLNLTHAMDAFQLSSVKQAMPHIPGERQLARVRNAYSMKPGIHEEVLLEMGEAVKGKKSSERCILAFDGMTVKDGVVADLYTGQPCGLEDVGDLVTYTEKKLDLDVTEISLAKECVQLMATTLDGSFRVPMAFYMLRTATTELITAMVDKAIIALHAVGVTVGVIVCDGASYHRKWQQEVGCFVDSDLDKVWGDDTSRADFRIAMAHPLLAGEKIYLMSDPVHLMKKAAENLYSSGDSDFHTKRMQKDGERLNWDIFRHAFETDRIRPSGAWLAPKITQDHIDRSKFTRLKTKYSTQLMSRSFQRAVSAYNTQPVQQQLKYMALFDNYIDIMNSGKYRPEWSGNRQYLSSPIKAMTDRRITELVEMVKWFDAWYDENESAPAMTVEGRKERFISRELYFDLRLAIRGFVAFCSIETRAGREVIPRLYNQDCVEGWFSLVRAANGSNTHPTPATYGHCSASAFVQSDNGGMATAETNGNVTENHSSVDTLIGSQVKTQQTVIAEKRKSAQRGKELAKWYKIPLLT